MSNHRLWLAMEQWISSLPLWGYWLGAFSLLVKCNYSFCTVMVMTLHCRHSSHNGCCFPLTCLLWSNLFLFFLYFPVSGKQLPPTAMELALVYLAFL